MILYFDLNSQLSKEQLNPYLKEYVEKYGIKDYHGNQSIEIDAVLLCHNVDSIIFYDDSNITGSEVVSLFLFYFFIFNSPAKYFL